MNQKLKFTAAAVTLALAGSQAMALEVYKDKGWTLDISGSVNAFYTSTRTDSMNRSTSIENGLLPGYLNVTATTQQAGWDVKGVIGYWPGINSNGAGVAGVGKTTPDVRTNYLSFGKADFGTMKLGRDVALFQSNAILNDMTLIGVGGGAGSARNINTTLGGIGAGYIYCEFQPQITYTSPDMNGFKLNLGVFDNKAWFGWENQDFSQQGVRTDSASGYEFGAKADIGSLGLMAQTYNGKGIGNVVAYANGVDAGGHQRTSRGYLLQATYTMGAVKLGINHGVSKLEKTRWEGAGNVANTEGTTLGAYYSLTSNITLVGELNRRTDKTSDLKTDTVSAGAILFF